MIWDGLNRRRFIRVKFPYTIHIFTLQDQAISTYTENVSVGGVMVVIKEKLEVSSAVDLEIYLKEEPTICKGRVSWVREKKSLYLDDLIFFNTGIEFYEIEETDKRLIKEHADSIVAARTNHTED